MRSPQILSPLATPLSPTDATTALLPTLPGHGPDCRAPPPTSDENFLRFIDVPALPSPTRRLQLLGAQLQSQPSCRPTTCLGFGSSDDEDEDVSESEDCRSGSQDAISPFSPHIPIHVTAVGASKRRMRGLVVVVLWSGVGPSPRFEKARLARPADVCHQRMTSQTHSLCCA